MAVEWVDNLNMQSEECYFNTEFLRGVCQTLV